MLGDWELDGELSDLSDDIISLESQMSGLEHARDMAEEEVRRLTKLLRACHSWALEAGDRIVEITEEFADG